MRQLKPAIQENDLILVHLQKQPAFFARVENIAPDFKPKWWQVTLLVLQLPLKVITWIIDDHQIRGEEFTMGGIPVQLERVIAPPEAMPAAARDTVQPSGKKESLPSDTLSPTTNAEPSASGTKSARILSLGSVAKSN
ncbi:hypothetical protein L0128_11190 [candidate division KSB1 bacterium]|nr:hypothetical protein [candidate division KSB1 bacterium]